jgi:hypothetical protein
MVPPLFLSTMKRMRRARQLTAFCAFMLSSHGQTPAI